MEQENTRKRQEEMSDLFDRFFRYPGAYAPCFPLDLCLH